MKKENCLVCRDGIQAFRERLTSGNYDDLVELQLCDTCCKILLESVSTTVAMKGEQDGN